MVEIPADVVKMCPLHYHSVIRLLERDDVPQLFYREAQNQLCSRMKSLFCQDIDDLNFILSEKLSYRMMNIS